MRFQKIILKIIEYKIEFFLLSFGNIDIELLVLLVDIEIRYTLEDGTVKKIQSMDLIMSSLATPRGYRDMHDNYSLDSE